MSQARSGPRARIHRTGGRGTVTLAEASSSSSASDEVADSEADDSGSEPVEHASQTPAPRAPPMTRTRPALRSTPSPGRARNAEAGASAGWAGHVSPTASTSFTLNEEDRAKMVADVVFYVLTQEGKRAPLKKSAVFQAVHLNGKPRPFQEEVWRGAQAQLLAVFGLALLEHGPKKGTFFVVNKVGEDPAQVEGGHLRFSDRETAHLGLLHVVLGLIFMSNDVLRDDVLFQFLKKLGLSQASSAELGTTSTRRSLGARKVSDAPTQPDIFGNIRDLVFKDWAQKQQYLEIKKLDDSPDPEQPNYEIRWGPRAEVEIKKSAMLTLIANLYGCSVTNFRLQYNKVIKLEGEGAFRTQAQD